MQSLEGTTVERYTGTSDPPHRLEPMPVERIDALEDRNAISRTYAEVTRAAVLGLVMNLFLGVVKLIGGIVGNSFALIADAVNSIGDVVTTVVVLFALRVAQRPADAEHPYGHTRAEGIAASNVALLVIVSAIIVGWEAIQRINVQHDIPPIWTLWIAGANILIKEGLYQYKVRVGRRTGSSAIIANAWDHRSDALCASRRANWAGDDSTCWNAIYLGR